MIKRLPIANGKMVLILVGGAVLVPLIFLMISLVSNPASEPTVEPAKSPLPTFGDAPRVKGELIIQYVEGEEFNNLPEERQQEITAFLESEGVVTQEKLYESTEVPLSTYYLLRFREGVNIETAAEQIYGLPEISGAQPNTEVGLF